MSKVFLNAGSGACHIPGFVNLDVEPSHKPDLLCDCKKLADFLEPNSVDGIISIHMLEHLSFPVGVSAFLIQAMVVLKRKGTLRLVVPDLMKVAKLYVAGDNLKSIYDGAFYTGPDCPATRFMYFCRAWEHTVLFDEILLRIFLSEAGFVNIRPLPFGESNVSEFQGLDRFESESISMEANKP